MIRGRVALSGRGGGPSQQSHVPTERMQNRCALPISNKKLSCRRETARRFVSLNILLSHLRSLEVIWSDTRLHRSCMSPY